MKKITLLLLLFTSFAFSQDILMQNGSFNQCSGTFYDSGGMSANYGNGESFVLTICPDATDNIVQLNFTAFNTQANLDTMTIYDGDSTAAPSLGTFSGGGAANSPGLVEATTTNATGCLTIEFISDGTANTTGWAATITCFLPCQDITAVLDSTVPAQNGAGNVEAAVNETITFNGNGVFSNSGAGATYSWDFGDGNMGTGQSTTHTYTAAGIYDVTLTITDTNPNGCQSTNNINLQAIIGASSPGNPNVDAGPDLTVDCNTGCVDITASFLDIGETNTYNTSQIVFVPPFPFNGLTNSINTNIDDNWSGVENLPFDFCFFTNTETQFQVGSNGVIRFDVDPTDTGNGYALAQTDDLPNNANPTLGEANIFTPCHDIDPSVNNTNEIRWEIIGTAPNRVLAVSYFEVPLFSCTTLEATHMAVMYETTNVIDIYIRNSPSCTTFNGGRAVVGIQNNAGDDAFVPPGRNVSDSPWTATEEAWRFTPAGDSVVTFEWLDDTGAVISTDPTFNVCPSTTTTYTARVTYNNCNGDVTVVTDDVTVSVPISVDLGPDQNLCIGDPDVVLDATIASGTATYQWALNGANIAGETNPTYTVSSPDSGTYTVTVVDQGCTVTEDIVITFSDANATFTTVATCDGATVDTVVVPGGTFSFNPAPTDGAVIDPATGTVTGGTPGATYTIQYTTDNTSCPDTSTVTITVLDADDATFTMTPTCDGGTATITGTTGGDFAFNPVPTDGAVIDATTGTVTGGTSGTTYTVEYTTTGVCPATSTQNVTVHPLENADFTTTATCDGGTVTITGNTGGTFTLNPAPTDGTVIDATTGTVTGGTSLTTYTIQYTTGGPCPETTTADVTVLLNDDASFSVDTETCDGGTVVINGTAGGTFTFNPVPGDGATIDPNTGEVTNGTSGATYTIQYNTSGSCPAFSQQDLNVLPADDASFTMTPGCDGATATITGLTGGTFAFNPAPTDGAVIDTATGGITMGVPGTTYTVEYTTNGPCVATESQDVTIFTQPVIPVLPAYEICDNDDDGDATNGIAEFDLSTIDASAINGQADVVVSYYATMADAQATPPTNAIGPAYTNTTPVNQTIYIRLDNTVTGCVSVIGTLELMVNPLPVATAPTPLELCDDDTDGLVEFDLTVKDAEIINGQANMSVTYYETQADAEAGTSAIGPLYTNTTPNSQIIIASLQDNTTGCSDTVELTLIVYALPVIPTITDYELCDYNNTGDEQESFDLTTKDAEIANGQLDVTISYHLSAAEATAGTGALISPYLNTSNPETIHVRVENTTTSCVNTSEFDLIVNPIPVPVVPTPLEVCDDNVPDGITQIDLTIKNAEISGNNPNYQVTYYETQLDADNEVNPIGPVYTNTVNGQIIFVRVEDVNTGCYDTTTLTLQVEQAPVACTPTPLEYCDPDSDGFGEFDLTQADNEVACGVTAGLVITYHETMADAENNINAITGIYNNIVVNMQTIYVRIESSTIATDCASFVELQLIVNP
ncbi:PKD domain-containing protein, partial [Pontimicrobium sp. MEBiC01747]